MRAMNRPCLVAAALLVPVMSVAATRDTRLADAAKRQDRNAMQALLKQGADVNGSAPAGATALHWAAYLDDLAMADLLFRAGANTNATNELGVTPLLLASENGSTAMVERLLKAGANPNAGPKGQETPLMVASRVGSAGVVKLLLAHGADVNGKEGLRGQTALMWAASQKHPDVAKVLVDAGADVNARTIVPPKPQKPDTQAGAAAAGVYRPPPGGNGFTPLLFAARAGDLDTARILLDARADPNDTSADGLSALLLATVRGYPKVAMLLLERGANPNADGPGYTTLHWAAGSWESELTVRAITIERQGGEWYTVTGLREGRVELIKALLARGAEANARMKKAPPRAGSSKNPALPELEGATPLLLAAMAGEPDVIRALVAGGADVGVPTKAKGTPLMAASGLGRVQGEVVVKESATLEAAKLLVELGADVNAVDEIGNTALHYAAYMRRDSIVQLLVSKGAAVDVKNKYGETPLWVSELVVQFSGGGTFQIQPSSTGAVLRGFGARASEPVYTYARPTEWPDNPRSAADQVVRPPAKGADSSPGVR